MSTSHYALLTHIVHIVHLLALSVEDWGSFGSVRPTGTSGPISPGQLDHGSKGSGCQAKNQVGTGEDGGARGTLAIERGGGAVRRRWKRLSAQEAVRDDEEGGGARLRGQGREGERGRVRKVSTRRGLGRRGRPFPRWGGRSLPEAGSRGPGCPGR